MAACKDESKHDELIYGTNISHMKSKNNDDDYIKKITEVENYSEESKHVEETDITNIANNVGKI